MKTLKNCGLCLLGLLFSSGGVSSLTDTGNEESLENSRIYTNREKIEWKKVRSFAFENPDDIKNYKVPEGKWKICEGGLTAVEGERNRVILLIPGGEQYLKIEFETILYRRLDGKTGYITVLLNSTPSKQFFASGYALTTGSYWNNCSTFYKQGKPLARTEYSPVVAGKRNKVSLEYRNGHIIYWLNGKIILEAWDNEPLKMQPSLWIGIRTWATDMRVEKVTVYEGKI
ncbi:MAG: hypothetical protein PHV59_06065 [Victivallales bacterium]|nr:hypothetical protein [Victivallales bacterium]